ncbi:MAG TPA: ATP-NAD kinase family protein [Candidatus Udaeobacter sp.]|nr:ATP-NAD kinase family protein [Candidatus Udaeobacter sp.]
MAASSRRIGLIVNPIAGMGGSVALKGTDGAEALAHAQALGAEPKAEARTARALRKLAGAASFAELVTVAGVMGEAVAEAAGLPHALVAWKPGSITTAADTREAAREMKALGVALILFAGGDGTARDILAAVGDAVPILGIPCGVKMHSAVFAVSPEAAGQLAALVAREDASRITWREGEVMDVDEDAVRAGRLSARLYGYARIPFERSLVQGPKARGLPEDAALEALAAEIAAELQKGVLYILGPGSTTKRILKHLGLEGTLLGVDAVLDRELAGRDLTEEKLAALLRGRPARIIVSVVGGQGHIFGRGNQQIGPSIIREVGRDNIVVLASQAKLLTIAGNRLLADTGDPATDRLLAGFIRVRIGPSRSTLMRVAS